MIRLHSSSRYRARCLAAALFVLLAAAPAALHAQAAGVQVEKVWETPADLRTPESALFDAGREVIYVSNVSGRPDERDEDGFISRVGLDGQVLDLRWVDGLNAPKGLAISGDRLFAADIDTLVEIDIEGGEIVERYPAEGAVFLNDVAVDEQGNVYVSDTSEENSAVYRLSGGNLELWLKDEALSRPNGLLALPGLLVVGTAEGELLGVAYDSKEIEPLIDLPDPIEGIDGIALYEGSTLLVSDWNGVVVIAQPRSPALGIAADVEFETAPVLDTRSEELNTADISFIQDRSLLLVPTFSGNRLAAYRVTR
jgi:hypothetical protein